MLSETVKNTIIKMLGILPDKLYISLMYSIKMGKKLNWKNPQTFNEKLQWLKLHDRKQEYSTMVDKYAAKEYVAQLIGENYIIPTLGVWDRFEEIDFDQLPNQFVLKCTHDSGGLVVCRDKTQLDKNEICKKINRSLKRNYYWNSREWPYKNVKPRIIAEMLMSDETQTIGLTDYKFYCFNGQPRFLYVSTGLEDHATASISFLTLDWQFAQYARSDYHSLNELPSKPKSFDSMVDIARKLSDGIAFLRVDLYEIGGNVYFSELTFSPCGGFMPFTNEEHDLEIGNMLQCSCQTKRNKKEEKKG